MTLETTLNVVLGLLRQLHQTGLPLPTIELEKNLDVVPCARIDMIGSAEARAALAFVVGPARPAFEVPVSEFGRLAVELAKLATAMGGATRTPH